MDDETRWLTVAAEILNAADPGHAHDLLVATLHEQTRAGLAVRVALSAHDPDFVAMSVDGYLPYPPRELWPDAELVRAHPINRFHADTLDFAPVLMTDVMAAGWDLDGPSRDLMVELGLTEQQLSIPIASSGEAFEGWVLLAEDSFAPGVAALVEAVHPLLVGLDRHVRLLEQARAHLGGGPCPDAVRLTPREQVILCLIRNGHTVVGMAQRLAISPRTVHKHQQNLYRKLGAVDRLSAVLAAQRLGMLPPHPEPLTPDSPDSPGP